MRTLLQIYVADHLAGSSGGRALARRAQHNNRGTPLGAELARLAVEIDEDARTLAAIADELGVSRSPVKDTMAVVAERAARLKANGRLVRYSPLSRVFELEGLLAAIDMKRSLWRALAATPYAAQLARFDLAALEHRATEQRERLVPHHAAAAVDAL